MRSHKSDMSHIMKLHVSSDDVRLDFADEDILVVKHMTSSRCEQLCLDDPICKVSMFDTNDSSCLIKRITKDASAQNGNMDDVVVSERKV